jgi:hypothetical protein
MFFKEIPLFEIFKTMLGYKTTTYCNTLSCLNSVNLFEERYPIYREHKQKCYKKNKILKRHVGYLLN